MPTAPHTAIIGYQPPEVVDNPLFVELIEKLRVGMPLIHATQTNAFAEKPDELISQGKVHVTTEEYEPLGSQIQIIVQGVKPDATEAEANKIASNIAHDVRLEAEDLSCHEDFDILITVRREEGPSVSAPVGSPHR